MAVGGSNDPRIGTVLKDKWRVDARLGRGGVATVYAATHRNGDRVAIKVLNREVARNPDIRGRFLREGYAANAVAHPGVVRVLDDDTTPEGQPFLVMDLLTGELVDARRIRKGGRLPLIEVLRIGDQVLDVLAAAHEKGIIHRDIKPENIFLCESGEVRVLDFGIARMRQAAAQELTATGMLLGTPEFMSPEQANGIQGAVDFQTDIWATGATLFTLLSGEAVHEAATTTAQLLATVTRPARSLASVTHDLPGAVVDVVDQALAYDKQARWPNARAMQRALSEAGRGILTGDSSYAAVLRRPVVDLSNVQGPISDDSTTAARIMPIPSSEPPVPSSESFPTHPRPMNRRPVDEDAMTVAESRPPVSPPTRTDVDLRGVPRLQADAVPVSEDAPTRVVAAYAPEPEAPTRVSPRQADMMKTLQYHPPAAPRGDGPRRPNAHDDEPIPQSKTSVMLSPPMSAPVQLGLADTTRMPAPEPASMGGFILKKRQPAQSEVPTVKARAPRSSAWTKIAIGVGVGVLVLWVLLVVVLRALFR